MKPLSEVLSELADRVKNFEDSVAETTEKGRDALQARRRELEEEFDRKRQEFDTAVSQAQEAPRSWWAEARNAIDQQIADMRAGFEQWQQDRKDKSAEQAAETAEERASAATALANYFLNAAEWAAVQARLARAEADEPSDSQD